MSDHYFTPGPGSRSDERVHEYRALGQSIRATTDAGVFSKRGLDDGSALMLKSLPALNGRVLDLGCGWGAMGLAIAKAYPDSEVVMSDVNARAADLCARNIALNGIKNARAVLSDGLESVEGAFDFVVTNPPIRAGKKVVYRLLNEAFHRLNDGGALYVVIRKQQGAPSAEAYLAELFGSARRIARDKGYWILESRKGINQS